MLPYLHLMPAVERDDLVAVNRTNSEAAQRMAEDDLVSPCHTQLPSARPLCEPGVFRRSVANL
jgi:hypothetical protein